MFHYLFCGTKNTGKYWEIKILGCRINKNGGVTINYEKKDKNNGLEKDLHDLSDRLKSKLNELRNLYRENKCHSCFIKDKKLTEEYENYRIEFYHDRKWKN